MSIKEIDPEVWSALTEERERELEAMYREREKMVLEQWNKNWSLAHIARYWGITRERARQIKNKAESKS